MKEKTKKIIFFDTETTDIKPGQIAQLSYVITDDQLNMLEAKNFYFSVDKISSGASRVNGLTVEKLNLLSDGKKFSDYHQEIHKDLLDEYLVAHNIRFDVNFLRSEFLRQGISFFNKRCFCTMNYFKSICAILNERGRIKNPKLGEVVNHLRITDQEVGDFAVNVFGEFDGNFHDSRYDVAALYQICKKGAEIADIMKSVG